MSEPSFNTVNTAAPHYINGSYCTGFGPDVVVVLGSCRVLPILNALHYLNVGKWELHLINLVSWYFDEAGHQVDPNEFTKRFETNPVLLDVFRRCKWFIHEHAASFGMFNTDPGQSKHIYQFGMKPEHDIAIPNFHDIFIILQELVDFDEAIRNEARAGVSDALKARVKERGIQQIERFLDICSKSSIPEFGPVFRDTWRSTRYFWTGNHVSHQFTNAVFRLINDKFLKIADIDGALARVESDNMYSTPCTRITVHDREMYQLTWPQADEPLRIP